MGQEPPVGALLNLLSVLCTQDNLSFTPSPKIVELMNSGTLLSVEGLGLCPQGEEKVYEKLGGKLATICLEQKGVLLFCVLTGTHLPLKSFSFCFYVTFLKS